MEIVNPKVQIQSLKGFGLWLTWLCYQSKSPSTTHPLATHNNCLNTKSQVLFQIIVSGLLLSGAQLVVFFLEAHYFSFSNKWAGHYWILSLNLPEGSNLRRDWRSTCPLCTILGSEDDPRSCTWGCRRCWSPCFGGRPWPPSSSPPWGPCGGRSAGTTTGPPAAPGTSSGIWSEIEIFNNKSLKLRSCVEKVL